MIFVIKANGEKEPFDKKKIIHTVCKAGVDDRTAVQIANKIAITVHDGDPTHEIYKKILSELKKLETAAPFVYQFREAVSHLGPMIFERYIMKLLESYGFECKLDQIVKGKLVEHEIDVLAKKNNQIILVECKRHVNPHRFASLNVVLSVWARLEDIEKVNKKVTNAWLVTNTKLSEHAIKYAKGKGMYYTGWGSGGEYSLDKIISKHKMYPVTLLDVDQGSIKKLIDMDILTIPDLLNAKTLPFSASRTADLISQAQKLSE